MQEKIKVTLKENEFHKSSWWLVDDSGSKVCKLDRISSIDMEKINFEEILNKITEFPSGSIKYVIDDEILNNGYSPGYHYFPDR